MKKVLVISFSQSGQLDAILDNFLLPFEADIDRIQVSFKKPFPFPWTSQTFFDVMPESVLEIGQELNTITFKHERYDLVVFGYQPWFLSPSIPATSILKHEGVKARLKDTPVVTVIGARNMWINAQESVKRMIANAGGHLVGNVPLVDRSPNLLSAVAIVHWMMTGKKTRKWGIFPLPGVSEEDIHSAGQFGEIVTRRMKEGSFVSLQQELLSLNRISINTNILFIELRAKKLFNFWANKVKNKGTLPARRRRWLIAFRVYLNVALFGISPIVLVLFNLIIRPLSWKRLKQEKLYFCSVNLK